MKSTEWVGNSVGNSDASRNSDVWKRDRPNPHKQVVGLSRKRAVIPIAPRSTQQFLPDTNVLFAPTLLFNAFIRQQHFLVQRQPKEEIALEDKMLVWVECRARVGLCRKRASSASLLRSSLELSDTRGYAP